MLGRTIAVEHLARRGRDLDALPVGAGRRRLRRHLGLGRNRRGRIANELDLGAERPRAPYYTADGGASWRKLSLPGVPDDDSDSGWGTLHFAYYLNRHIVTADRVNIGTYYLYHPSHGVFRSSDGGATWKLVHKGEVAPFSGFNAKLTSVPGRAGHLFFTSGQQGDPRDPNPSDSAPFLRSTDGGVTWSAISGVAEVYAFGFGKADGAYPTIFIVGWVRGAYGIWRSADEGKSWHRLGPEYALDSLDEVKTIDGDKDDGRRVYIGFAGSATPTTT